MKKKVLFIIADIYKSSARSIRCRNIIIELCKLCNNYEIHLLSLSTKKNRGNFHSDKIILHEVSYSKIGYYLHGATQEDIKKNKSKSFYFKKKIKRILVKLKFNKLLYPDKFIFELYNLNRKLRYLINRFKYKNIILFVMPTSFLLLGKTIKKYSKESEFVVDLGDPITNNAAIKRNFFINHIFESYEAKLFKLIDKLIVTNESTKNYYKMKYRKKFNNNIFVIPNGVNIYFNYKEKYFKKGDTLKLIYAGQFYKALRDPSNLFIAIEKIKTINTRLDIYGSISLKFFSRSILEGKSNIYYHGELDHNRLIEKYKKSDVLVFIDNAYGIQQSGKIYELIAMKKPILFIYENKKSHTFNIVKNYRGIEFAKNDVQSIINGIKKIYKNYNNYCFNFNLNSISWNFRAKVYKKVLDI